MSTTPIPRVTTVEEAMGLLPNDAAAYGLPPDAPDEQVQARRQQAAENLSLGSRANAAYWDSRSELEQLVARAQGHGKVAVPPSEETPTAVAGPTGTAGVIEGNAEQRTTEAAPGQTETAGGEPPAESAEDRLRAQLRAANIEPEV